MDIMVLFFFFQAEDGIRDYKVTGVQTCALPISLMRIEPNGRRTVLADRYEGKRFGGPNDVVVKRDGAIYFTDTYGAFRLREKDPRRELDFNSVFRWKDGKLSLVVKDMPATNGLAFSPEGKHLGTIRAPEQATNVGFGEADRKTLFIAARTGIYKIRVNTPGI